LLLGQFEATVEPIDQTNVWHVLRALYFPSRFRIRSDLTRRQYVFAVRELEGMLSRPPVLDDLTDETFCDLVRYMEAQKLASRTINDRVGRLKTLATWLWRKGIIRFGPTVEKIPEPIRIPRAWNREQLADLFAAARNMPGRVGPFLAGAWWTAFLATAWWSGERTTALLALRWEWLEGDVLYVPGEVRKGGRKDAAYRLPVECMALLAALSGPSPLIFPWPSRQGAGQRKPAGEDGCRGTFYNHYDVLLRMAGLPTGRYNKVQKVRRSHATWKEIMSGPGSATRSLMHDDPSTAMRYYLDRGLLDDGPELFRPWSDPLDRTRPPGS
jgi:integrase